MHPVSAAASNQPQACPSMASVILLQVVLLLQFSDDRRVSLDPIRRSPIKGVNLILSRWITNLMILQQMFSPVQCRWHVTLLSLFIKSVEKQLPGFCRLRFFNGRDVYVVCRVLMNELLNTPFFVSSQLIYNKVR